MTSRHCSSNITHLREVVWLQEEPRNMGAWSYIAPRLQDLLSPEIELIYVGRAAICESRRRLAPVACGRADPHPASRAR